MHGPKTRSHHSTFWILVYLYLCRSREKSILCCFLGLVKMGDMIYDAILLKVFCLSFRVRKYVIGLSN